MSERIPVGILGATGMVGQEFVTFLRDHPWFDLTWLGASDRSAGKPYREATSWRLGGVMPANVSNRKSCRQVESSCMSARAAAIMLPPFQTPHSTTAPAMPRASRWAMLWHIATIRAKLVIV